MQGVQSTTDVQNARNVPEPETPVLETARLVLRRFTENDVAALLEIHRDRDVNRFLPWFPLDTPEEAGAFYEERYARPYATGDIYRWAICPKENGRPIGYVSIASDDSHDLGYGLAKEFWHQGIATEAAEAVVAQARRDGIPYLTATHDVNNPASGCVMRPLGMRYRYSYEERWMPKDLLVTFRMYQLNLDGNDERVYRTYWDAAKVRFVERL